MPLGKFRLTVNSISHQQSTGKERSHLPEYYTVNGELLSNSETQPSQAVK